MVSNEAGTATSEAATLTVINKPVITLNPESAVVALGEYVTFTVEATGTDLCCQWQYKKPNSSVWKNWKGRTSANLLFKGTSSNNNYQYRCVISNEAGTATSEAATLTVINKPVITLNPESAVVALGEYAAFTVEAEGENLSYQWQFKKPGSSTWKNWDGRTSATLIFKGNRTNNNYQYRCVVTNEMGSTYSTAATLTVRSTTNAVTPELDRDFRCGKRSAFAIKNIGSAT